MSRKMLAVLAAMTIAALAVGGVAVAGHLSGDVRSYTGCYVTSSGAVNFVQEGTSPLNGKCPPGSQLIHLSGGDITSVTVGPGLTGGGTNGALTIGLSSAFSLPQSCASGQLAKWNGSAWICASDNDTTYQAGTGLDLNGTTFSVEPDAFVQKNQSCPSGQFATGATGSGIMTCAAPPSPPTTAGIEMWQRRAQVQVGVPIVGTDLITLPLPAGTFLVTGTATFGDLTGSNGDEEVEVSCSLLDAANNELIPTFLNGPDVGSASEINGPRGDLTLHGAITLPAAASIRFHCFGGGGDEAHGANMTAIRVGALHTP